jgi:hypothetical protein
MKLFGWHRRSREERRAELDEEVRAHLAMAIRDRVARGENPHDAELSARREFGNVTHVKETTSGFWSFAWTESVEQDVRYAARGLARSPGFAATVAITFALGVGANAAVFSLIDPLLLRNPVAVADPDRVHRVYYTTPAGTPTPYFSGAAYTSIRAALDGVAQIAPKLGSDSVSLGAAANAPTIVRELATSEYLPLLAGAPALGRFFSRDEADAAAPLPRAVLSYALWSRAFGGDSAVLGREVALGTQVYAIVGVAPKGFTGVDLTAVDVWTTAVQFARLPEPWFRFSSEKFGQLIVRTARNLDDRQIATRATQGYRRAIGDSTRSVVLGSIVEGRGPVASKEVLISSRVAGVALIVLLVACANIATLSLVRAMRRRREIAVRVALGVSRRRLVAQLLTENLLLAVAGGTLALLIAWWGGIALRNVLVPDLRLPTGALSTRVAGATLLLSLIAGVLAGLAPALSVSRPDLADVLKGTSCSNALRRTHCAGRGCERRCLSRRARCVSCCSSARDSSSVVYTTCMRSTSDSIRHERSSRAFARRRSAGLRKR